MLKRFFCTVAVLITVAAMLFAGDVAQFADIGFSADGSVYMFGEYGTTDKTYEAYANIYAVDITKNDFIATGLFKTPPSAKTAGKTGAAIYNELRVVAESYITTKKIPAVSNSTAMYIAEDEAAAAQIEFRDFTSSTYTDPITYAVRLSTIVEGNGVNALSSFYLVIEKRNAAGTVVGRKIGGNPKTQRKGVVGYRIDRILSDKSGKNLIFVIEKKIADKTGVSIRYMIEAVNL